MKTLVLATRNAGKLVEMRRFLESAGINVIGLKDLPELPEVAEDGETFSDNARKKAETIARLTGLPCLADDSGLVVAALGGQPGVLSARFAGPTASDADNNRKLLEVLADVPEGHRQAAFHCVMALSRPGEATRLFRGRVEGVILPGPMGEGGFGYDPLFFLVELGCTMAQLPLEEKNRISHRGQALRQVLAFLGVNSDTVPR
jgi:XTP/dITP diphosphohydrolase